MQQDIKHVSTCNIIICVVYLSISTGTDNMCVHTC